MVGWEEIAHTELLPTSIVQIWRDSDLAQAAIQQGAKIIMSPAPKVYLDMKYNPDTPLGMKWAAYIEVQDAYNWDPVTYAAGVSENDVLGVEAPIWSETLETITDVEFMAFPRLPGCAEIGWSPVAGRAWDEYKLRLGAHGERLTAMGVNFYRSTQIP
jgi:hexosaminidase